MQLLQQQQQQQQETGISTKPPPGPLPMYWVVRESRSQPGYYYYFNFETGVCSWYPPQQQQPLNNNTSHKTTTTATAATNSTSSQVVAPIYSLEELGNLSAAVVAAATNATTAGSIPPPEPLYPIEKNHSSKRSLTDGSASDVVPNKRSSINHNISSNPNKVKSPHQVRVIHILKKHAGSRKPTSWRVPVITATKEEARTELQALLDVLQDVQEDKEELRATMEELARTESDCSSYKRNGDLGYFTRKKMQPQFEDTAFALQINELSNIIETSSGLHVLLRIG